MWWQWSLGEIASGVTELEMLSSGGFLLQETYHLMLRRDFLLTRNDKLFVIQEFLSLIVKNVVSGIRPRTQFGPTTYICVILNKLLSYLNRFSHLKWRQLLQRIPLL